MNDDDTLVQRLEANISTLKRRLDNSLWHQQKAKSFLNHDDDCDEMVGGKDYPDDNCSCGLDVFTATNTASINQSKTLLAELDKERR